MNIHVIQGVRCGAINRLRSRYSKRLVNRVDFLGGRPWFGWVELYVDPVLNWIETTRWTLR